MPALFCQRQVWLPTAWGLLILVLAAAAMAALLATQANRFLAISEPVRQPDGRGARVLVIEGWIGEPDLDQAVQMFRRGGYERIVTSGGPIPSFSTFATYADRAADYLRRHPGLRGVAVDAVPSPATRQDRTFASAVWVRDWAARTGVRMDSLDVLTHDVHARRTRAVFRLAFGPQVPVGVIATPALEVDMVHWWTNSHAFKSTLGETLSLAWTTCCFWPAASGSHEERWAVPPRAASPASTP